MCENLPLLNNGACVLPVIMSISSTMGHCIYCTPLIMEGSQLYSNAIGFQVCGYFDL